MYQAFFSYMKKEERKIIKFSIGRFTNGINLFFGVMLYGKFYGFIIKNYFSHIVNEKKFVIHKQYLSNTDTISFIRKIRPFYYYTFHSNIDDVIEFLIEILNIKVCAWKYNNFINDLDRRVLLEKNTKKIIYNNYKYYNEHKELELIQIIAKKFSKKIVTDIYIGEQREHELDIYSHICTVWAPFIFNDKIHIELNISQYLEPIVQNYIVVKLKQNNEIISEIFCE